MPRVMLLKGNHAAAYACKSARVGVVAAYPITPQSPVVEKISEFVEAGELPGTQFVKVESEQSAITAVIAWAVVWFASNKKLQKSLHFKGLLAAAITLVVMEGCFHCLNEYWEDSEEVLRDVNEAELANTTRLQEALIMQAYLCRDDPEAIIQHIEWDRPHPKQDSDDGETMAAEGKV